MLARKEHRNQHSRDFMVLQVPAAVVMHVLALYEHLHRAVCSPQARATTPPYMPLIHRVDNVTTTASRGPINRADRSPVHCIESVEACPGCSHATATTVPVALRPACGGVANLHHVMLLRGLGALRPPRLDDLAEDPGQLLPCPATSDRPEWVPCFAFHPYRFSSRAAQWSNAITSAAPPAQSMGIGSPRITVPAGNSYLSRALCAGMGK